MKFVLERNNIQKHPHSNWKSAAESHRRKQSSCKKASFDYEARVCGGNGLEYTLNRICNMLSSVARRAHFLTNRICGLKDEVDEGPTPSTSPKASEGEGAMISLITR